jgi:hypothetical protein
VEIEFGELIKQMTDIKAALDNVTYPAYLKPFML